MSAEPSPFDSIRHVKKKAFLVAYAQWGQVGKACEIAGIDRTTPFTWKGDAAYREAFAVAQEMAITAHEDEASRRAMGWDEERIAEDGTPYTIRKYSDTLLIVRLKALKPDVYRDNATIRHEGEVSLVVEDRLRLANERIMRLRRVGPDPDTRAS